jgi:hypothetical protein
MLMQITIKTYLFVFDVVIPFGSGCIGRWGTMVSQEDGVSKPTDIDAAFECIIGL